MGRNRAALGVLLVSLIACSRDSDTLEQAERIDEPLAAINRQMQTPHVSDQIAHALLRQSPARRSQTP
jgi:hypothetical protein